MIELKYKLIELVNDAWNTSKTFMLTLKCKFTSHDWWDCDWGFEISQVCNKCGKEEFSKVGE